MKQRRFSQKISLILSIGILACLLFAVVWQYEKWISSFQIPANVTATGEGSYLVHTNIPRQVRFTSPQLGISFLILLPNDKDNHYQITQVGKKVYLYDLAYGSLAHNSQEKFLQVFTKDPKDSLATAIQKTFLQNYSPRNCFVKFHSPRIGESIDTSRAYISFALSKDAVTTDPFGLQAASKCPSPYTQTDDVREFRIYKNTPDKFVFFDTGQWDYLSGDKDNIAWEDTLQFIH